MNNYFIKLTPLSPFFFAGEKNFGGAKGEETNYFAKSNLFPQQTTILGMLRKELLIQKGIYREYWNYSEDDKNKIKKLIGKGGFKVNNHNNNFGRIESISPVFINRTLNKTNQYFISTPKDNKLKFKKEKSGRTNLNLKTAKNFIPLIEDYNGNNYNAKKELPNSFISSDKQETVEFDNIFKEFIKIGNAKDKSEGDEEKFFKQLFYTMKKDFSFAFFAEIDFEFQDSNFIVYMGGDNSSFKMEIRKTEKNFHQIFINGHHRNNKTTLLSDALVDEDIYEFCDFAITETMDFRTIKIENNNFDKKKKYTMLKRGSVFFTDDKKIAKLKNKIRNNNFQKIGYNIFK
ncbi:MAG: hypothetical protein B6I26_06340 [Desulfobacteraceae bacterium 4572_130]|nr:MAG: hypothetical protein B6I26_06340 [Desulfobacteraceae bacterium 4572_130]